MYLRTVHRERICTVWSITICYIVSYLYVGPPGKGKGPPGKGGSFGGGGIPPWLFPYLSGKEGRAGRDGEKGAKGHKGEKGEQGPPGMPSTIVGPQGERGTSGDPGIPVYYYAQSPLWHFLTIHFAGRGW